MSKTEDNKNDNKKKQVLLGVILVVIGLLIAGYFLIKAFRDNSQTDPTTTNSYELETLETTEPSREPSLETLETEETTKVPETTVEPTYEFETPSAPTHNTDEPTPGLETPTAPVNTTPPQTDPPETRATTTAAPTTKAPTTPAPTTTKAPTTEAPTTTAAPTTPAPTTTAEAYVYEDQTYSDKDHVAAYIHEFGHLPANYITKSKADNMSGWQKNGYYIGGDYFGNYEKKLPTKSGRKYYECDISYTNNNIKKGNRGTKRLVYSNDGLIFYTDDHYESFVQLYP